MPAEPVKPEMNSRRASVWAMYSLEWASSDGTTNYTGTESVSDRIRRYGRFILYRSTLCWRISSRSFCSRALVLTVSISIALRVAVVEKLRR